MGIQLDQDWRTNPWRAYGPVPFHHLGCTYAANAHVPSNAVEG